MSWLAADLEAELRARYAEPHRHYHGQSHIDSLLARVAEHCASFHHPDVAEIAIWFHDAIYQPGATDNERASAALMRRTLDGLIDPTLIAQAEILILATQTHQLPADASRELVSDTALFLDFDMSILGAEPQAYDRYAEAVRREFAPLVGEYAYRAGRADFLRRSLASGSPLFHSPWGRNLEAAARANMARELSQISR